MLSKLLSFFNSKKNVAFLEFDSRRKRKIYNKIKDLVGSAPNEEQYYIKAFTHRSYLEKTITEIKSNERLEFLGDSILGKVVAEYLFKKYPNEDEGFLTKARSHLVNKHSLERIGFNLNLQDLVFINDKYLSMDKKKISNIVADCLEALIAAIYLDMGEEKATIFVTNKVIVPQVENGDIDYDKNYKGQLLEYAHANKLNQPIYNIIAQTGPQHDTIYTIEVIVNDEIRGIGVGPNKKIAEQNAAEDALRLELHTQN